MAGVAMLVLVVTLLTFKKVKLIFGHPVQSPEPGIEPGTHWCKATKLHRPNLLHKKDIILHVTITFS